MRVAPLLLALAAPPAMADVVIRPDLPLTGSDTIAATARVPLGDTLIVMLPAQPGTGYSWDPRLPEAGVLLPIDADCVVQRPLDGRVGGVEPVCFAYRATGSGAETASFVYRRPWEDGTDGLLRYDLAVTVTPGE